jgi:hypothetical protein
MEQAQVVRSKIRVLVASGKWQRAGFSAFFLFIFMIKHLRLGIMIMDNTDHGLWSCI